MAEEASLNEKKILQQAVPRLPSLYMLLAETVKIPLFSPDGPSVDSVGYIGSGSEYGLRFHFLV